MSESGSLDISAQRRLHLVAAAAWPLPIYAWLTFVHAVYGFRIEEYSFESPAKETATLIAQTFAIGLELYLVVAILSSRISTTGVDNLRIGKIHGKIFFGLAFAIWVPVQTYVDSLKHFDHPDLMATDPVSAAIEEIVSVFVPLAFMLGFFWLGATMIGDVLLTIRSLRHGLNCDRKER